MSEKVIVVAGHICLDIIPKMRGPQCCNRGIIEPGHLTECGAAAITTGGAVSNTGLALHRLGLPVRLVGKVGMDLFGRGILDVIGRHKRHLNDWMTVVRDATTSYSVVISPRGSDRAFLHCPGANADFTAADVPERALRGAMLFHFGYPPLMRRMYDREGAECVKLFSRAKRMGITTSLDMSLPDLDADAGRVDWRPFLESVLPFVDVFLPSIEEILFMLDRQLYERHCEKKGADISSFVDAPLLDRISGELLLLGAAIVGLKLGDRGLYLRTTAERARLTFLRSCAPCDADVWLNRELYAPCFKVKVAGTNGAGDCTIAGFLAGLVRSLRPEECARMAVAVGACSVEAPDAWSGVRPWAETRRRIKNGWRQMPSLLRL